MQNRRVRNAVAGKDYYEVLGIKRSVSEKEIRSDTPTSRNVTTALSTLIMNAESTREECGGRQGLLRGLGDQAERLGERDQIGHAYLKERDNGVINSYHECRIDA